MFRSRLVRAMETYSQVYLIGGVAVLLLLFFGELCRGLSSNLVGRFKSHFDRR